MGKLSREQLIQLSKQIYTLRKRKQNSPLSFFYPYEHQRGFWTSTNKDKLVLGGNQCGKTRNGAAYVITKLFSRPNLRGWACTWADLSVPIQQQAIYEALPKKGVRYAEFSEQRGFTNRIIIMDNNSSLRFKTYDQGWLSFQGAARDIIWDDEEAPEDVHKEQRMRLVARNGELIRTMTPLQGFTYTYEQLRAGKLAHWYWSTLDNKSLRKDVIMGILSNYSAKEALVRSTGEFLEMRAGRMYYAYSKKLHKSPVLFGVNPNYPVRLTFDFNVTPMITTLFQIVPGVNWQRQQKEVMKIVRVFEQEDTTTDRQCIMLKAYLSNTMYSGDLIIYGDATKARSTLVSETADVNTTNWTIVKKHFPDADYRVPTFNPPVVERIEWVNAKLLNLNNEVGILLNAEHCEAGERDFEQVIWDKSKRKKDEQDGRLTHFSDTVDYVISKEFRLTTPAEAYQVAKTKDAAQSTQRATTAVLGKMGIKN